MDIKMAFTHHKSNLTISVPLPVSADVLQMYVSREFERNAYIALKVEVDAPTSAESSACASLGYTLTDAMEEGNLYQSMLTNANKMAEVLKPLEYSKMIILAALLDPLYGDPGIKPVGLYWTSDEIVTIAKDEVWKEWQYIGSVNKIFPCETCQDEETISNYALAHGYVVGCNESIVLAQK